MEPGTLTSLRSVACIAGVRAMSIDSP